MCTLNLKLLATNSHRLSSSSRSRHLRHQLVPFPFTNKLYIITNLPRTRMSKSQLSHTTIRSLQVDRPMCQLKQSGKRKTLFKQLNLSLNRFRIVHLHQHSNQLRQLLGYNQPICYVSSKSTLAALQSLCNLVCHVSTILSRCKLCLIRLWNNICRDYCWMILHKSILSLQQIAKT